MFLSWNGSSMDVLSMAGDRASILDAQQEWQPCELITILHSNYLVAERHKVNGVSK